MDLVAGNWKFYYQKPRKISLLSLVGGNKLICQNSKCYGVIMDNKIAFSTDSGRIYHKECSPEGEIFYVSKKQAYWIKDVLKEYKE